VYDRRRFNRAVGDVNNVDSGAGVEYGDNMSNYALWQRIERLQRAKSLLHVDSYHDCFIMANCCG